MSDRIVFNSDSLIRASSQLEEMARVIADVRSGLNHISTSEEWWTKLRINGGSAREMMQEVRNNAQRLRISGKALSVGVSWARQMLEEAERQAIHTAETIGQPDETEETKQAKEEKSSSGFDLWGGLCKIWDGLKTGAKKAGKAVCSLASFLVDDWNNKGFTYRLVKGAGAALKIVGGVATTVCAVTGTGITAGLSAPVTAVIGAYGVNDIFSGIADLKNCITGDVEDIGKFNPLQSISTGVMGQVGEWFGSREIGESIGDALYQAGSITTTVISLKNVGSQILQSPTATSKTGLSGLQDSMAKATALFEKAKGELPTALDGLGYIVTQANAMDVSYQLHLLSKQVPNICTVASEISLTMKGVTEGLKTIQGGAKVVDALFGTETAAAPAFLENLKETTGVISGLGDMKESFEKIESAAGVYSILLNR